MERKIPFCVPLFSGDSPMARPSRIEGMNRACGRIFAFSAPLRGVSREGADAIGSSYLTLQIFTESA
ncbi:MAG: hypothetical protein D6723_07870 [Acidobacteria bacterium]|nr:MAG: hypothetical protein D6723_07870 [Acidobacteriota bacterium]